MPQGHFSYMKRALLRYKRMCVWCSRRTQGHREQLNKTLSVRSMKNILCRFLFPPEHGPRILFFMPLFEELFSHQTGIGALSREAQKAEGRQALGPYRCCPRAETPYATTFVPLELLKNVFASLQFIFFFESPASLLQ